MLRRVTVSIISSLICGITHAAPKIQDVNVVNQNPITVDNPTFTPSVIRETTVVADGGQVVIIDEAQVIREIVVLPSPGVPAAEGCRLEVFIDDHPVSYGGWNGDQYGSFKLVAVGPIDVKPGMGIKAVLTPLPVESNGTCSAELAVFGIVMPNI